jgi:uncharacterized protein (TIGR03437 family)
MHRLGLLCIVGCLLAVPAYPRLDVDGCGTNRERARETLFLHRQSVRSRLARRSAVAAPAAAAVSWDTGNIAVIEDTGGIVARLNQFNLEGYTLRFAPAKFSAGAYQYSVDLSGYDADAAASGVALSGLGDDDSRLVSIPFSFSFFGSTYNQVYVNSDGNLTFGVADQQSTGRSLGRLTAGAPRIGALFDDLDPSKVPGSVRVLSQAARLVVTWVGVPEYASYGTGPLQSFQVALYADGRIELSYSAVSASGAVVGIAPGNLQGTASLVSFRNDTSGTYVAAVAERFAGSLEVDIVTLAQRFYETHEDSYDYLAIFNNMGIPALSSAVAYENTVRNTRTGIGDSLTDLGSTFGSASRLQAVLNLGPLSQYPSDPNGVVPTRAAAGDTPLTVIAHETGHLFLAFASVRDPNDITARPMLGSQLAHWSFLFNSEASLLEGERIRDNGEGASPRFITTDTVQGYAPLDQYLMGLRAAADVPSTFLVNGPSYLAQLHPMRNYSFDGSRQDISVEDVIAAEGARIPDYTVAQRRFRFAFILVVAEGTEPSASDLAKVEAYRAQFEPAYSKFADNRASADATLKRSLKLSLFPAAGVLAGGVASATLTVATAPADALPVTLSAPNGFASLPAQVTIPAGQTSATFAVSGVGAGVEEVTAAPGDSAYETAFARVQVAAPASLQLVVVSGDNQVPAADGTLAVPIVVRVTDANRLPYPGVTLLAVPSAGGRVAVAAPVTDQSGQASIVWTPGTAAVSQLKIAVDGVPSLSVTLHAGSPVAALTGVVNAASGAAGLAPGALARATGVNLSTGGAVTANLPWPASLGGTSVTVNGTAVPLLAVSGTTIDFYIPADTAAGTAVVKVLPGSGPAATMSVTIAAVAPGVFFDAATGYGAVLRAGTGTSTASSPAGTNDVVEIYCTGLGPTQTSGTLELTRYTPSVYIGGTAAAVLYSGLTATPGVYQINAQVPSGLASGVEPLQVRVGTAASNEVNVGIR